MWIVRSWLLLCVYVACCHGYVGLRLTLSVRASSPPEVLHKPRPPAGVNGLVVARFSSRLSKLHSSQPILSPFDESGTAADNVEEHDNEEPLELTTENVELVLNTMRPYLIADGGNVKLAGISDTTVMLELQGACGTCASSAMTMTMGLERKLKTRIPEIKAVVQAKPAAPSLTKENVEVVLKGVRPFLAVAGGSIALDSLRGAEGAQPGVVLRLEGTAAALQSVKAEIQQRIQKHFMSSVQVEWI